MDYKEISQKIIDLSGGKENFTSVVNCMTRVRILYKDESKVDKQAIKNLPGVLGTNDSESFQIIVGPGKSTKLQEKLNAELKLSAAQAVIDSKGKDNKAGILKTLSNIFVPIIPAIIASGILQGVNNVLTNTAALEATKNNIAATDTLSAAQVMLQNWNLLQFSTVLGILGSATFGFLAIYVGISAAKQFMVDIILGGLIGAMTLSPALGLLGLTAGQGGLFGVILGVWILSKVDIFMKKIIPDIVDVVLRPMFSLLLTGILYFVVIMPLTGIVSDWILNGIMFLINSSGILGGFVLAAISPLIISTGMHHGLTPINIELINTTGATPISAIQIMSNAGLVGAGLALYVLSKNEQVKEIAKGVLPTTFLAVGEPTMYGLVIPSGFGFITASLGAGFGGAMVRLLDVQQAAIGAAGMSAIPLIADGKYLQYLISYFVGLVAAFLLTYVVGKARHYE